MRPTARRSGMPPSSGISQASAGAASATMRQPIISRTMQGKVTPAVGIVILMVAATSFAANHVSARIAFDHGASVAAGVVTRATGTALVLLLLMKVQGVRSEEHTSELQSLAYLVCRLLLEKKK